MKTGFFFVKWGDAVRINTYKTNDPLNACKQCYGCISNRMRIKFISTRKSDVQNTKFRNSILESREGWQKPIMKGLKATGVEAANGK